MKNAPWPGNIRELQHTMEKAVIVSEGRLLDVDGFSLPRPRAEQTLGAAATLEELEKAAIVRAVEAHGGNLSAVAAQLGITRQTLYNKIRKYGV